MLERAKRVAKLIRAVFEEGPEMETYASAEDGDLHDTAATDADHLDHRLGVVLISKLEYFWHVAPHVACRAFPLRENI